jgi:aspartate carbamoyltransferase regulatory subunit
MRIIWKVINILKQHSKEKLMKSLIHGVEKDVTEKGTISVKDGKITIHSVFDVALTDYNITIPKVVGQDIAKVVKVTIDAPLSLYIKK